LSCGLCRTGLTERIQILTMRWSTIKVRSSFCVLIVPHSFLWRRGQFKFDRRPSGIARLSSKKKLPKRARDVAVVWYRFYCPALLAVAVVFVEPLYTTMSLRYLSHRSPINVPLLIPHMSAPIPAHRHIVTPCNPVTPNHLL
jgi:hypothetical protein